jgi:hypothetical protein
MSSNMLIMRIHVLCLALTLHLDLIPKTLALSQSLVHTLNKNMLIWRIGWEPKYYGTFDFI